MQNLNSWFSPLVFVLIRWTNACFYNVFQKITGNGLFCYGAVGGTHPTVKIDLIHRYEWTWAPASADWCISTETHFHLHLRMGAHFFEVLCFPKTTGLIFGSFSTFIPLLCSLCPSPTVNKGVKIRHYTFHWLWGFFPRSVMTWCQCLHTICVNTLVRSSSSCRWVFPLCKWWSKYINSLGNDVLKKHRQATQPPRISVETTHFQKKSRRIQKDKTTHQEVKYDKSTE